MAELQHAPRPSAARPAHERSAAAAEYTVPTAAVARPDQPPVRPVPRTWASHRRAVWCGVLPLASGLTITALAVLLDDYGVLGLLAKTGMITLLLGSLLLLVGLLSLVDHWGAVKGLSPAELAADPPPAVAPALLLLLANPPAALACLFIGGSQLPYC